MRVQVASGSPTWDLVQQGNYSCAILDKEGNVEKLDPAVLNIEGIPDSMKGEGWIGNLVYGAVLAWNDEAYADKKPSGWADMWDTETFPVPPMIYSGNDMPIVPGMVLFLHAILIDAPKNLAMSLGHTILTRDGAPEVLSRITPEYIVRA